MTTPVPYQQWQEWLSRSASTGPLPAPRIVLVKEVDSTQDEAKRLNASPGDVLVAWRQTGGRGRLDRKWADTGEEGVAMTIVTAADRPERLAIATAVGVAGGIESVFKTSGSTIHSHIGIKWPNDIVVSGRKIAGILIEQVKHRALIGVGVNVRQHNWPAELRYRAISMFECGMDVDRLLVVDRVLQGVLGHVRLSDADLAQRFRRRDVLIGKTARFMNDRRVIEGLVVQVDPMRGLLVQTSDGDVWLPAATTSIDPGSIESLALWLH